AFVLIAEHPEAAARRNDDRRAVTLARRGLEDRERRLRHVPDERVGIWRIEACIRQVERTLLLRPALRARGRTGIQRNDLSGGRRPRPCDQHTREPTLSHATVHL